MNADRSVTRAAVVRPSSADEKARTVELTITSERDPGDGLILSTRQLPEYGPAPVPVLLSHENNVQAMAGRIEALRVENGQLVGLARFADAPASEVGFQLARAGVGVSVGASYRPDDLQPSPDGRSEVAMRWRLREVSLTPVPADPYALVRSAPHPQPPSNPQPDPMTESTTAPLAAEPQETAVERAAERCELAIRRSAAEAQLPAEVVDELVTQYRHRPKVEGVTAVVRRYAQEVERRSPTHAGHPARVDAPGPSELETAFQRALSGQGLDKPLVQLLREHGYTGRSGGEILQRALCSRSPESWLSRGFHSTSDAPALFIATGDRQLQARYAEPVRGITNLARIRTLTDYRTASVIDVALVGKSKKILEGGEIQFATMADEAGTYKPFRHGLGFAFSFEALANDDLAAVAAVLDEASQTGLEAEADDLVNLLTATPDGANGPDGLPLFDSSRNNSTSGALDVETMAEAVKALRTQKTIGGRRLSLEPGFLLVGPESESRAAQLLNGLYQPEVPEEVNPWRNLQLLVEPGIEDDTYFIAARGPRAPFELGRVAGMPRMLQEEHFDTSALRVKIESAHGCAVADPRSIVRVVIGS